MLLDASQSQLVLIDYQARLMPAIFEAEAVFRNATRLAQLAKLLDVPAWGTEQNPSKMGENPAELRALCHRTLAKMQFSGVEEGLGEWLRPPVKAPASGTQGDGAQLNSNTWRASTPPTTRAATAASRPARAPTPSNSAR